MQFQSFQPFNRYAPFMPWWHHTLRHCGALGMGSLTGTVGEASVKRFSGRVWSVRYKGVSHGWNSRPEKTTCVRSLCKDVNAANGSC
jgi:hypothetical protein